jgi:hypothetical protein
MDFGASCGMLPARVGESERMPSGAIPFYPTIVGGDMSRDSKRSDEERAQIRELGRKLFDKQRDHFARDIARCDRLLTPGSFEGLQAPTDSDQVGARDRASIERDRDDAVRGLAKVEQCMAEFEHRWAADAHRPPSAGAARRVQGRARASREHDG